MQQPHTAFDLLPFPSLRCLKRMGQRCNVCHRRRKIKEKKLEDDDLEDPTTSRVVFTPASGDAPGHARGVELAARPLGNGQDADECLDMSWQMPELVFEKKNRPGARIHKGTSLILPDAGGDLIARIVSHLPVLQRIRPCWHLGYSMAIDGVSLRTLYRQVMDAGPCLLIIEDSNCCIFGCFASEGLKPQNRCHGTHESFLFRFSRDVGAWRAEVFCWSQHDEQHEGEQADNVQRSLDDALDDTGSQQQQYSGLRKDYFEALRKCHGGSGGGAANSHAAFYCDYTGIVAGVDGPAIFIDQDLLRGVSCPSKAFGSPCMAAAGPDFVVRNLEVWHWVA